MTTVALIDTNCPAATLATSAFPIFDSGNVANREWRTSGSNLSPGTRSLANSPHDTHLVALMRVYSVSHILTFNGADFERFMGAGNDAVDPFGASR